MRLELFDYPLPPEQIAQTPLEPRDASRLLVLREDGSREHRRFLDFPNLLNPGDLLVFNDTRVLPARLFGRKPTGGQVEVLLLQRLSEGRWEGLVYPGRRLQEGATVLFGEGELRAEVVGRGDEGTRVLRFDAEGGPHAADELIHRLGQVPLPPYIHERLDDPERYQTVYAREEGSAAAPTAGLHFTERVFRRLREKGVGTAFVTLHVGIATFRPVKVDEIDRHEMHAEWYSVPPETAAAINACTGRVIAVGTTTVRCLESAASSKGEGRPTPATGTDAVGELQSIGDSTRELYIPGRDQPSSRPDVTGQRVRWRPTGADSGKMPELRECRSPGAQELASSIRPGESTPSTGGSTFNLQLSTFNLQPGSGQTRLYITPGYRFRVVDALLTNFHMPRSSLMILVSAFAGVEPVRAAYRDALEQGYRFLSFGDAMFIERRRSEE